MTMRQFWLGLSLATSLARASTTMEGIIRADVPGQTWTLVANATDSSQTSSRRAFQEESPADRIARKKRRAERRKLASHRYRNAPPPPQKLEPMPKAHVLRELSWFSGDGSGAGAYSESVLVDPAEEYDKWAQAYRMLGGYIDCDHDQGDGDHHSGSGDRNDGDGGNACSRWMIWASYVNPNYQGNEYDEYFGDDPAGVLDCHDPDTEWELLGVYRQEFYQYIEQISKHLWAIDEYEYVVALAGLAYMTDDECYQVDGNDDGGVYVSIAPQAGGKFILGLYQDAQCLIPDESGATADDYGLQNDIDLGSKDATDDDGKAWAYDWWYDTQEYTLTQLNEVYEEFKYCTSCVDYPTYQDGYYIGDYGTDDDDLINQCWKFWSHDSYTCEADCLAKANAQGTILAIEYGEQTFGHTSSSFYSASASMSVQSSESAVAVAVESPLSRLLANAFVTLSFLLFVATFLAFAVARRSRYRESRSSRSRRLLDEDVRSSSRRSTSRRRSKSQPRSTEGDGLFKNSPRRSRKGSSKASRGSRSKRSKSQGRESHE